MKPQAAPNCVCGVSGGGDAHALRSDSGTADVSVCCAMLFAACCRYGLQHLSDQVLGDLCASICQHAAAGLLPARWFACFCGLGPAVKPKKKQRLLGPWQLPGRGYSTSAAEQGAAGSSGRASPAGGPHTHKALRGLSAADAEVLLGSAAAADFFVFCACQLAYPNSVVALFPEAQEALPLIRSNLAMESIKAAFRWVCAEAIWWLCITMLTRRGTGETLASAAVLVFEQQPFPPSPATSVVGKSVHAGTLGTPAARHSL
jgi:hypothetical protein